MPWMHVTNLHVPMLLVNIIQRLSQLEFQSVVRIFTDINLNFGHFANFSSDITVKLFTHIRPICTLSTEFEANSSQIHEMHIFLYQNDTNPSVISALFSDFLLDLIETYI